MKGKVEKEKRGRKRGEKRVKGKVEKEKRGRKRGEREGEG